MKYNNLAELFTAIANSIRGKTGGADKIPAESFPEAIDGIQSGGVRPTASPKDVNFYDYDGTLLHSYTVAEAQALTELPPLPTQNGLICQGWNWTLDNIKAHNRAVDVGATYITDDGKTRLYIKIAAEGRMDVPLCFYQTVANGVTIDWGDGSSTETLIGTGKVNTVHTYASIGEYVITLDVANGCTLDLGHGSTNCVLGSTGNNGMVYCNMLQKVELGTGFTSLGGYAFRSCSSLASINIPDGVMVISGSAFYNCYSLASIVIPDSVTSIASAAFQSCSSLASIVIPDVSMYISDNLFRNCYSLASIVIPDSFTSIGSSMFFSCYSLASIVIPDSVTSIAGFVFANCYGMKFYDFTTHTAVPTLVNTNAFQNIPSDCEIRVPAALYDEWIAATNWSTYAANIVAV